MNLKNLQRVHVRHSQSVWGLLVAGILSSGGICASALVQDPPKPQSPTQIKRPAEVRKPIAVPQVNPETMKFWSFQPVKRPSVPAVKNGAWVRNPIDAFILSKLE